MLVAAIQYEMKLLALSSYKTNLVAYFSFVDINTSLVIMQSVKFIKLHSDYSKYRID